MKMLLQVALAWVAASTALHAQSRCDCEEIVGQCSARVTELPTNSPGAKFRITADTEQCSIVEWSVDGDRGMITIWDDGEDVTRVSPRKPGGSIKVHSCRVCKDRLHQAETRASGAGACKQYEFSAMGQTFTENQLREGARKQGKTATQLIAPMVSGTAYQEYLERSLASERRAVEQGGVTMPESHWAERRQKAFQKAAAEQAEASRLLRPLPALAKCVDENP